MAPPCLVSIPDLTTGARTPLLTAAGMTDRMEAIHSCTSASLTPHMMYLRSGVTSPKASGLPASWTMVRSLTKRM